MTKRLALKTSLICLIVVGLFPLYYWYNNRLFLLEAKILWTQEAFTEESFRVGTTEDRAMMAVDLIERKNYIGVTCKKIPELLGEQTGDYYYQESNTTFRLTNKGFADWILTFICDKGVIREVFIRKSCCSVSQEILFWILKGLFH